ncbi:MAG: ParB/RepB/Spo0J family partition protein [Phycisphaerales bacterium]|nr:ParB/RepB/Spo0J family partition protein [Phycisphaerales bacterium]
MSKPANRLGRGLSALLGPKPASPRLSSSVPEPSVPPIVGTAARQSAPATGSDAPDREIRQIDPARIKPNPHQPRQAFPEASLAELAASIRENGVIQPILVRPAAAGEFELVAGERRLRAAIQAGLVAIPAIIREITDRESVELAIIENVQREDLGPLDRAAAYEQYVATFQCSVDELAKRLGESRASVANYIRLLRLPAEVRDAIHRGDLGMGQARAVAGVGDPTKQRALAQLAIRRNLSVRQVEALAKDERFLSPPPTATTAQRPDDRQATNIEQSLSRVIGMPVRLMLGKKKNSGRLVIEFRTLEEFDRLSERLAGSAALD